MRGYTNTWSSGIDKQDAFEPRHAIVLSFVILRHDFALGMQSCLKPVRAAGEEGARLCLGQRRKQGSSLHRTGVGRVLGVALVWALSGGGANGDPQSWGPGLAEACFGSVILRLEVQGAPGTSPSMCLFERNRGAGSCLPCK